MVYSFPACIGCCTCVNVLIMPAECGDQSRNSLLFSSIIITQYAMQHYCLACDECCVSLMILALSLNVLMFVNG